LGVLFSLLTPALIKGSCALPRELILAALLVMAMVLCTPSQALSGGAPAMASTTAERTSATDPNLFALILRPGGAWKPGRPFVEQGLRPHFDYWMALYRKGRVVTAGPMGSDSGLVLLLASSAAEAEEVMRADPAITAGIFVGEVRPYAPPMVNAGALPKRD
jgi:uncharacterized protein